MAGGIVDGDRPESVDRYFRRNVELVDGCAIVLLGRDIEIEGLLVGIASPRGGGADQVSDSIDLVLAPNALRRSGNVAFSTRSASRTFF